MILGFKPQFVEKILDGTKIHTIREDVYGRWKPGMKIHFTTGIRTKDYNQFHEGECTSIQRIEIYPSTRTVLIDGWSRDDIERSNLAQWDGFESQDAFFQWFNKPFSGKIIHWTNFKY
ncbi:MAG: ASCH domain-containing protein, partial [Flavobacteriales bacterium]